MNRRAHFAILAGVFALLAPVEVCATSVTAAPTPSASQADENAARASRAIDRPSDRRALAEPADATHGPRIFLEHEE